MTSPLYNEPMLKFGLRYFAMAAWLTIVVMLLLSCSESEENKLVAELNVRSYEAHYENLDSTRIYAEKALGIAKPNSRGWAHAMNDIAFYYIAKMQYNKAEKILNKVVASADDDIELLVSRVQLMRLCQRKSDNKNFYHERHYALKSMTTLEKNLYRMSRTERKRFAYARTEYWIVLSTYLYYIGQPRGAYDAIENIKEDDILTGDMPQLLAFYYNIGSGGLLTERPQRDLECTEFNYLIRCYMLARQCKYVYWEANSMQALSEKLQDAKLRSFFVDRYRPEVNFLNVDNMPDSLLAGNLAQRALELFVQYGDVYQVAGAWRTLSVAYYKVGDFNSALICLNNAIGNDTNINKAPDLVASIREQMSIVYSALDNKKMSDYNRNIYLDIQEYTRQDRLLEARAEQLASSLSKQDTMIAIVVVAIVLLVAAMALFIYKTRKNAARFPMDELLHPLDSWQKSRTEYYRQTEDEYNEIREQNSIVRNQYEHYLEKNIEQRAKVSLASSVTPLINRLLHEVKLLQSGNETPECRRNRYEYIVQLASSIEQTNSKLTNWIKLKKGEIVLRIESFELQQLFDTLRSSEIEYKLKGLALSVRPTNCVVKADKVLTLFMLNTIAENARRYTPNGGTVDVYAVEADGYVEVSVKDTGRGMSEEKLSTLFKNQYITDTDNTSTEGGHGFGLLNCKGIIDKYKKMSSFFSVCTIGAESEPGRGSRVFFRLPKGIRSCILCLFLTLSGLYSFAGVKHDNVVIRDCSQMYLANQIVDSIYYNNVSGNYNRTISLADSCVKVLNDLFVDSLLIDNVKSGMCLRGNNADDAFELKIFRDSVKLDYSLILALRNEVAVAALALHDMDLYEYNNNVFTKLFRACSADRSLATYIQKMQQAERNRNVAIIILILLLLAVFPAYYFLYYRYKRFYSLCIKQIGEINGLLRSDKLTSDSKIREIRRIWQGGMKLPANSIMEHNAKQISNLVEHICSILGEDVAKTAVMENEQISLEEERKRIAVKRDRLYVVNNILDNSLSTLKHETMFYPSRLKQLLQGRDYHSGMSENDLLATLDEIASYYETMYTTLLGQTVHISQSMSTFDPRVALAYLLAILRHKNGDKPLDYTMKEAGNGYVKLEFCITHHTAIDEDELTSPDYFVLCQIMRDIGEYYRARGCGVELKSMSEQVEKVVITIKNDIWRNLKL